MHAVKRHPWRICSLNIQVHLLKNSPAQLLLRRASFFTGYCPIQRRRKETSSVPAAMMTIHLL